jgi:hypothetical protein
VSALPEYGTYRKIRRVQAAELCSRHPRISATHGGLIGQPDDNIAKGDFTRP